jgi:hypothetical protein
MFKVDDFVCCVKVQEGYQDADNLQEGRVYKVAEIDDTSYPVRVEDKEEDSLGWYPKFCFELTSSSFTEKELTATPELKNSTKNGGFTMETLKNYFKKNSEVFITLAIVILIDEYLFKGALREKIKDLLNKILGQTSEKLLGERK